MKVYRITVDSAARQSGHEFDFEWDLSGFSSARDLKGKTWVAAVEWCDVLRYSEESPTFASNSLHPSALFLTSPALTQHNTWQSWNGTPSATICTLPGYVSTGFYGLSGDQPYVRKKAMGAIIQGDLLNRAGSLRFRVLRDGDDFESAKSCASCLAAILARLPSGTAIDMDDAAMRLALDTFGLAKLGYEFEVGQIDEIDKWMPPGHLWPVACLSWGMSFRWVR